MVSLEDPRIRQYVHDVVGDEGMRIAIALARREEATDTELAEELDAKPSHIRRVLYELYEARAAEYQKKKDKSTGWITFHWAMTLDQASRALEQRREKEVRALTDAIRLLEDQDFYACPTCDARHDFSDASEAGFHCPDHGDLLEAVDTAAEIAHLRTKLEVLSEAPNPTRRPNANGLGPRRSSS